MMATNPNLIPGCQTAFKLKSEATSVMALTGCGSLHHMPAQAVICGHMLFFVEVLDLGNVGPEERKFDESWEPE